MLRLAALAWGGSLLAMLVLYLAVACGQSLAQRLRSRRPARTPAPLGGPAQHRQERSAA